MLNLVSKYMGDRLGMTVGGIPVGFVTFTHGQIPLMGRINPSLLLAMNEYRSSLPTSLGEGELRFQKEKKRKKCNNDRVQSWFLIKVLFLRLINHF